MASDDGLPATTCRLSRRALRRSNAIDTWVGIVRDTDGRARMVITWEPRSRGVSAPQVIALKARTTTGTALFDGRLGQVGSGSLSACRQRPIRRAHWARRIDMTIYDRRRQPRYRRSRLRCPGFSTAAAGPVLLSPELVRARTLRDFSVQSRTIRRRPVFRPHVFTRRSASHPRSGIRW